MDGVHQAHHVLLAGTRSVLHFGCKLGRCLNWHLQQHSEVGGSFGSTSQDRLGADALFAQRGHHVLEVSGGTRQAIAQARGQVRDLLELFGHLAVAAHHRDFQLCGGVLIGCEGLNNCPYRLCCCVTCGQACRASTSHFGRQALGPFKGFASIGEFFLLRFQLFHSPLSCFDGFVGRVDLRTKIALVFGKPFFMKLQAFGADTGSIELGA